MSDSCLKKHRKHWLPIWQEHMVWALRLADIHDGRVVYPTERQGGCPLPYKRVVATATTNVHLVIREAQITRPRNGDLDF